MLTGRRRFIGFLLFLAGCAILYFGVKSGSENIILAAIGVLSGVAGLAAALLPKRN